MEKLIGVMAADIQHCSYAIGDIYRTIGGHSRANRRFMLISALLTADILIMNQRIKELRKEIKELKKTKGE